MSLKRMRYFLVAAVAGLGLYWAASPRKLQAQQAGQGVKIDADDIGGVVSSSKGPEAGVWVIGETVDLPTRYIKEVVTDDRGRYVIPDLPKAKYTVTLPDDTSGTPPHDPEVIIVDG